MSAINQANALAQSTSMTDAEIVDAMRALLPKASRDDCLKVAACEHTFVPAKNTKGFTVEPIVVSDARELDEPRFTGQVEHLLATLPDFTRGSILTSVAMSLNYKMLGMAQRLIKRDLRLEKQRDENAARRDKDRVPSIDDEGVDDTATRLQQFIHREEENNTSPADLPQSPEQQLYELMKIRAAFADAAFDLNPKARVGFDEMLDDAKQPRVNEADVRAFAELEKEIPIEIVRKMYLQYAEQRSNEIIEHEAALKQVLRAYDLVGTSIDEELGDLPKDVREQLLQKLADTVDRRQRIVDPMAINEPDWVKRMNPLARYKESKLLKGALDSINALLKAGKPRRRALSA